MAEPTLVTALRIEAAVVRTARTGHRVVRTGMGPRRALRNLSRLTGDGPVAVLGVAGGLAPHVRPGDVVVASEVWGAGPTVGCPSAVLLAGALRRAGLTVHVGPVVSVARLGRSAELVAAAARGAIAVDMETAVVSGACQGRPFAMVRVVSDTADAPLLSLGTIRRGLLSLRQLRRVVPVVAGWAEAAGPRAVTLASPRSFCAGVERAIDIVRRAVDRYGAPVYVRRQVVHNAHVVADLESHGAIFVNELDEVPPGARVVLAAHGVSPQVRAEAVARDLAVVDATCPLVAKVHQEVRRYADRDNTVILIGHADHEEVVGTVGEAPARVRVVANETEARSVLVDDPERVAFVMQTTLAVDEADAVVDVLRHRFPRMAAPRHDDICYATTNRQRAVRAIAADADLVLVIGSPNSSNSQRLVEVARRCGVTAYLVDDAGDVDLAWLADARRVGITAGASAPPQLVDELVDALGGLGAVEIHEHPTVDEDIRFALPKEVS